jgi:hypothetical protein
MGGGVQALIAVQAHPWFGDKAARHAMKSSGAHITCVAPSRYVVLSWSMHPSLRGLRQAFL